MKRYLSNKILNIYFESKIVNTYKYCYLCKEHSQQRKPKRTVSCRIKLLNLVFYEYAQALVEEAFLTM